MGACLLLLVTQRALPWASSLSRTLSALHCAFKAVVHGLVPKWALVAGPGEPPVAGMRKPPVADFGESILILSLERLLRMAPPVAGPGEPLVAAWVWALLTRVRNALLC